MRGRLETHQVEAPYRVRASRLVDRDAAGNAPAVDGRVGEHATPHTLAVGHHRAPELADVSPAGPPERPVRLALAGRVGEPQVVSELVRRAQGAARRGTDGGVDPVAAPGAPQQGAAERRVARRARQEPEQPAGLEVDVQVGAVPLHRRLHLVRRGIPEQVRFHLARPHHPHVHVGATVAVDRPGHRHRVLDARVGIVVLDCPEGGVVEGEHVDGGGAGRVRRIARGSARQPLVDVPDAIPVRVRKDVDELDAVGARVRNRPECERLRPAPGVCVVHGGRCGPHTLPERDAERFPGGWTGECHGALPSGGRGAGRNTLQGRRGGFRLAGGRRVFQPLQVGPGQAECAAFGGPETPDGEGQRQLTRLPRRAGRPLGAARAVEHDVPGISGAGRQGEQGEERWPERVPRWANGPAFRVCLHRPVCPHRRSSARSGRFRRLGEDVVRLAEVEAGHHARRG